MVSPAGSSNSFSNDVVNSLVISPDARLQNTSRLHKLSPRSVLAVIETIRCFTIGALAYFAYHSCLLPTVLLANVAIIAYVLKDRVKQLDAKNLGNPEKKTDQIASPTLGRSASTSSRISNKSNSSIRPVSLIKEENPQEIVSTEIKESFLNSLGPIESLSIADRYELLSICYSYLLNKQNSMPKDLEQSWSKNILNKKVDAKKYLADKYKHSLNQTSESFQISVAEDAKGNQVLEINDAQKFLGNATPSLIMEIVQALHQQISQEQGRHGNKAEEKRHAINADHAGKYAEQLRDFEESQKIHYTEDLKKSGLTLRTHRGKRSLIKAYSPL